MATSTTKPREPRKPRSPEDAVSYGIGHWIRFEAFAILFSEGVRSPSEIAKLIGENVSKVNNHIKELVTDGAIELVRSEGAGNNKTNYYRAVEMPYLSDEIFDAMSPEERRKAISIALHAEMAETLAAFRQDKMTKDNHLGIRWRWFNVDAQGREKIAEEQDAHWQRVTEIEVESCNRMAKSKEKPVSTIVISLGFLRSRTSMAWRPAAWS